MGIKVNKDGVATNKKGKEFSQEDILGRIGDAQGQIDFSETTGLRAGRVDNAQKELDKLLGVAGDMGMEIDPETGLPAGLDRIDFTDISTADRNEYFKDYYKRKGGLSLLHQKTAYNMNMDIAQQDAINAKNEDFLENEINPEFDKAQELIARIEEESMLNEEVLGKHRAAIVERVKGLEESRLHRVSSVLGLRGLDPGSPAGAALAVQTAEETDAMFAKEMRDLGLQAQTFNSQQLGNIAQMRSGLAMQKLTARNAALKGDEAAMREMQQGFAGFYAALEQQRRMTELMKELQSEQEPSSMEKFSAGFDIARNVGGVIAAPFTGGASLAITDFNPMFSSGGGGGGGDKTTYVRDASGNVVPG